MQYWWITFVQVEGNVNPAATCVAAESEEKARELASTGGCVVDTCKILPYPADPMLNPGDSNCPAFCWTPQECAGRTSCPKRRACSE